MLPARLKLTFLCSSGLAGKNNLHRESKPSADTEQLVRLAGSLSQRTPHTPRSSHFLSRGFYKPGEMGAVGGVSMRMLLHDCLDLLVLFSQDTEIITFGERRSA